MLQSEKKRAPYRDTRRLKASERRVLILQAAQSILLNEGFAALTVRRTAETAEIRMATLQYYFPTREKLFEAAFQDIVDKAWQEVMVLLDQSNASGTESRLRRFIKAMCETSHNQPLVGSFIELWAAARVHQYAADIMCLYYQDAVGVFAKLIHEARPELGFQRSRQLANLAMSLIEGHSLFNQMDTLARRRTSLATRVVEKGIMVLLDHYTR